MPPPKTVLEKKIARTSYLTQIMKRCSENIIGTPKNGWLINENNEFEIDYFDGSCYPTSITDIASAHDSEEEDESEQLYLSSEDEDEDHDDFDDNDWTPVQ